MRILIEGRHDIALDQMVGESLVLYGDDVAGANAGEIVEFLLERLRGYALDKGFTPDAIDAVLAKGLVRPLDIATRLEAIREFRETPAAVSLSAAGKRIANILKKADGLQAAEVDRTRLAEPAEQALFKALEEQEPGIHSAYASHDYQRAMTLTARLREPVDAFFDGVMVMVDQPLLKANRLALLARVEALCSSTADLSRLQPQTEKT